MHEGTIRGLIDVWYVSDMKKNCILLGVLVDKCPYISLIDYDLNFEGS